MSRDSTVSIRPAAAADAAAISTIVERAARISNARDYSADEIARIIEAFTLERVAEQIATRETFVAIDAGGTILGTAAYLDGRMRAVFVEPVAHGRGIGCALVATVEAAARRDGREALDVRASLTAVAFYERRGYRQVGAVPEGVPTILMSKSLVSVDLA